MLFVYLDVSLKYGFTYPRGNSTPLCKYLYYNENLPIEHVIIRDSCFAGLHLIRPSLNVILGPQNHEIKYNNACVSIGSNFARVKYNIGGSFTVIVHLDHVIASYLDNDSIYHLIIPSPCSIDKRSSLTVAQGHLIHRPIKRDINEKYRGPKCNPEIYRILYSIYMLDERFCESDEHILNNSSHSMIKLFNAAADFFMSVFHYSGLVNINELPVRTTIEYMEGHFTVVESNVYYRGYKVYNYWDGKISCYNFIKQYSTMDPRLLDECMYYIIKKLKHRALIH